MLERAVSIYEGLTSDASGPRIHYVLQAIQAEKRTHWRHLQDFANHEPGLQLELSDLIWRDVEKIGASAAAAGTPPAEARILELAFRLEEVIWEAYVQICLVVGDGSAKQLMSELSEQQARSVRTAAVRAGHSRGNIRWFSANRQAPRGQRGRVMLSQAQEV